MPDLFGAASDIFGGVGDLLGGFAGAEGSREAANYYEKAAAITKQETAIKEIAANRQIYQTLGTGRADIAASGLKNAGSAAELMRSSTAQGSITKSLIQEQGQISEAAYEGQAKAAEAAAQAQEGGGIFGAIGGIVGAFL